MHEVERGSSRNREQRKSEMQPPDPQHNPGKSVGVSVKAVRG